MPGKKPKFYQQLLYIVTTLNYKKGLPIKSLIEEIKHSYDAQNSTKPRSLVMNIHNAIKYGIEQGRIRQLADRLFLVPSKRKVLKSKKLLVSKNELPTTNEEHNMKNLQTEKSLQPKDETPPRQRSSRKYVLRNREVILKSPKRTLKAAPEDKIKKSAKRRRRSKKRVRTNSRSYKVTVDEIPSKLTIKAKTKARGTDSDEVIVETPPTTPPKSFLEEIQDNTMDQENNYSLTIPLKECEAKMDFREQLQENIGEINGPINASLEEQPLGTKIKEEPVDVSPNSPDLVNESTDQQRDLICESLHCHCNNEECICNLKKDTEDNIDYL